MSRTVRIDYIRVGPDGTVGIEYTAGEGALPVEPSGHGRSYGSRLAVKEAIKEMRRGGAIDPVLMALVQLIKINPNITHGPRSARTTFDFTEGTMVNG